MSDDLFVVGETLDSTLAEPFEVGTVQWVRRPGSGGREALASGFWFITPEQAPEPMEVIGHADECVYIVEGRVRIQVGRQAPLELAAGSTASINKGVPVMWTVLEPTVEFFVYS